VLAAAAVTALLVAPPAGAHVAVTPTFLESGRAGTIELSGPNERDAPMTGFAVTVPAGLELLHANAAEGWLESVERATAVWSGGSLAPGAEATFAVHLSASAEPGPVELEVEQRYADGVVRWPVTLTVVPASGSSSQTGRLLIVIGLIGALALVAIGVLAWRVRARPLEER
jgi:uncharacterized protein YcnI